MPSATHIVRPYAFDAFPKVFEDPNCPVIAIAAERTFWEKVTILHQEAHRAGVIPQRYSRHYYDLFQLAHHGEIREQSVARIELLADVVRFKKRFYPSTWAQYDLAVPGSLRLLPRTESQIESLRRDYQEMQVMLFGNPPTFDAILRGLQDLEVQLNAVSLERPLTAGQG